MRVLVVEDDVKLARSLKRGIEHDGDKVTVASAGDAGLALACANEYDVIVLDLMLPGISGFEVCEALRAQDRWTPVLMLTARTGVPDRIRGLDGGADDYLVKPFDFDELQARLRALVRRGPSRRPQVLQVSDLRIDRASRTVTRNGHQIELTAREFEVLLLLAQQPGIPVSRTTLLAQIWREDPHVSPNIVDVYIGYLRKKLESPRSARLIRTIRGKGFLLEAP